MRNLSIGASLVVLMTAHALLAPTAAAEPEAIPERAPTDKSKTTRFVLDNGLKVLIVSDPDFNISAAAMDVEAGSLSDPVEIQGLAHFLEHMLFLGTSRYPEPGEYARYLSVNGGYSNAFTAQTNTNYHFQVRHEALEGALDRFAQFFIAPLLNSELTDREMNAVNSEHEKNRMNDYWRGRQVLRSFYQEPESFFSTGDSRTLAGVTPEILRAFYESRYSSNLMSLVILSRHDRETIERWVREYFSQVPDRELSREAGDSVFLEREEAFRLVKIKPIKDIRTLSLEFNLPPLLSKYRSKPGELIGSIIGHEGEGSLLSVLKDRDLATSLGAGTSRLEKDYSAFSISIALTPRGRDQYREVVALVFSYIDLLRGMGIRNYHWNEAKTMASLDYVFSDHGEGARRAVSLVQQLTNYPIEDADRIAFLWEEFDTALYEEVLSYLTPDNMISVLIDQSVETGMIEPIYGTAYSYETDSGDFFSALRNPPADTALALPEPNPFIPMRYRVMARRPVKIIDDTGVVLWFLQDQIFQRPKVEIAIEIMPRKESATPRNAAMLAFYIAALNEDLNELSYPAMLAGLHYDLSADEEGLRIAVGGYHDGAMKFLEVVSGRLKSFSITQDRFLAIKDRIGRGFRNFPLEQAYVIARVLSAELHNEVYYSPEELLPIAESVTLQDLRNFAGEYFREGHLRGLVYGNLTADEARRAITIVQNAVQPQAITSDRVFTPRYLNIGEAGNRIYTEIARTNNSCFRRDYHFGENTARRRAAGRVISNFLEQPFYTEMRTKQQLGYIVWNWLGGNTEFLQLNFVIQSSDYPPTELRSRVDSFLATIPATFDSLTEEEFSTLKEGVKDELMKKPKTVAAIAGKLERYAFEFHGDFDRVEDELISLSVLTKAETSRLLKDAIGNNGASAEILIFARDLPAPENLPALAAIEEFKRSAPYRGWEDTSHDR